MSEKTETLDYQGKKQPWKFVLESDFIRNPQLSLACRSLYLILQSFVGGPGHEVPFPSIRTLERYCNTEEDTVRRYLKDLEWFGWLKIEHRRDLETRRFKSNAYHLLDGDASVTAPRPGRCRQKVAPASTGSPSPQKPSPQNTGMEIPGTEIPRAASRGYKNNNLEEKQKRKNNNSKSGAAPPRPAGGGEVAPSELGGAAAPDPAALSAAKFIEQWEANAKRVFKTAPARIPRDTHQLTEFFRLNAERAPEDLAAVALAAWIIPPDVDEKGRSEYWHCHKFSRWISTFLKHLPKIEQQLNWTGTQEQRDIIYARLNKKFR